jgi:hypothetical protein
MRFSLLLREERLIPDNAQRARTAQKQRRLSEILGTRHVEPVGRAAAVRKREGQLDLVIGSSAAACSRALIDAFSGDFLRRMEIEGAVDSLCPEKAEGKQQRGQYEGVGQETDSAAQMAKRRDKR